MSYRAKLTKLCRTRTIFSLWKPGAIHVLVSACGTLACTVLSMHTRAKRSSFKVYSITSVPAQPVTRYGFRCWFLAAVTLFRCYFISFSAPYLCPVQCCFISFESLLRIFVMLLLFYLIQCSVSSSEHSVHSQNNNNLCQLRQNCALFHLMVQTGHSSNGKQLLICTGLSTCTLLPLATWRVSFLTQTKWGIFLPQFSDIE